MLDIETGCSRNIKGWMDGGVDVSGVDGSQTLALASTSGHLSQHGEQAGHPAWRKVTVADGWVVALVVVVVGRRMD